VRSLGSLILALQDSVPGPAPESTPNGLDIVTLILNADPLVKLVLLTLLTFSAVSWAIVLYKQAQLRRAHRETAQFLGVFRKSARFSEVQAVCGNLSGSPLVGLFQSGYAELNAQLRAVPAAAGADAKPPAQAGRPTLRSLDAVDRALLRATTVELSKLEHRVPFLATTASITPYIGLFGTVWGIMMAFLNIAAAGSSSLGVVSGPIAEALIATGAGLFAAIPAVYFYNDLTAQIKKFANDMDDFSMEFLTIAERNVT
jgi:biopolymer transport protein TolQ